MRSSISLGLVSGIIGHLAQCVLLFEPRHTRKRTRPPHHIANIMSGSVLGIPLVYFMKRAGKDNPITKGAGFGMIVWALFYGARSDRDLYHLNYLKHQKYRSELLSFLSYLLFGVTTACAAVKLADPGTYSNDEYDFGF